jgi:ribosomal protein L10
MGVLLKRRIDTDTVLYTRCYSRRCKRARRGLSEFESVSRLMLPSKRLGLGSLVGQHARSYSVSVKPPRVYENKSSPRVYSEKKTFLYHQYLRLFESTAQSPLVFLQHNKFSVPRLIKLRKEIAQAASRHATPPPSLANPGPNPAQVGSPPPPTLSIIRTSLFGVALRDFAPIDAKTSEEIAQTVQGGLAVLSLPVLNPPQLQAILRALQRSAPTKPSSPTAPEELLKQAAALQAQDPPNPGRRAKRLRNVHEPELTLMGALIEGRVFKAEGVKEVARLPTLGTLHAQIIGLLSSPGAQLAGVLSEASGGKLARTLEGLKKSLELEDEININ